MRGRRPSLWFRVRDHWARRRAARRPRDAFERAYARVAHATLLTYPCARGLYGHAAALAAAGAPGAFVECGVFRGGALVLMALAARDAADDPAREAPGAGWKAAGGAGREIIGYDRFTGLPAPSARDPDRAEAARWTGKLAADPEAVRALAHAAGVVVRLVAGDFADTLPARAPAQVALLHLDCDWYDSVIAALDALYPRVIAGGVVQVDDYGFWLGARRAVDDYRARHAIAAPLVALDHTGVWWRKDAEGRP